jgi:trk system potassium uptake protein TrkA
MRFIVIGHGRTGAGLVRSLGGSGHEVTAVDVDPGAFPADGPPVLARTVVGIGFDREVLLDAGIETADGLAAMTGDDEVNAVVARLASRVFAVPKVVARLHDPRMAHVYRRLGVQVVAPVDWAVHRAAALLTFSDVGALMSLGTGQVDLVEIDLPVLLDGRPIDELTAAGEILPVAISRAGTTFLPTAGTTLRAGDIVHLAVVAASRHRLESIVGARPADGSGPR